jgi:mannose-6-phosphate isomerase-like protein (cupin superfamily)
VAEFTRVNLMKLDGGDRPVEARFARKLLGSPELGVSHFRYPPEFRSSLGHHHDTQEEVYIVVGGSGRMKLDDEIIDLAPWDVIRVAPPVVRAFEGGPDGLDLIVVGGEKPPDGDGHRVDDFWP